MLARKTYFSYEKRWKMIDLGETSWNLNQKLSVHPALSNSSWMCFLFGCHPYHDSNFAFNFLGVYLIGI